MTRDLFGNEEAPFDAKALVGLDMVVAGPGTDKAWLLARPGRPHSAGWIPKSRCQRGDPPHQYVFTMTRGDARERGWL